MKPYSIIWQYLILALLVVTIILQPIIPVIIHTKHKGLKQENCIIANQYAEKITGTTSDHPCPVLPRKKSIPARQANRFTKIINLLAFIPAVKTRLAGKQSGASVFSPVLKAAALLSHNQEIEVPPPRIAI